MRCLSKIIWDSASCVVWEFSSLWRRDSRDSPLLLLPARIITRSCAFNNILDSTSSRFPEVLTLLRASCHKKRKFTADSVGRNTRRRNRAWVTLAANVNISNPYCASTWYLSILSIDSATTPVSMYRLSLWIKFTVPSGHVCTSCSFYLDIIWYLLSYLIFFLFVYSSHRLLTKHIEHESIKFTCTSNLLWTSSFLFLHA